MFSSTLSFVGNFMGLSLITDYQRYMFNSSRRLSLLEHLKTPTFKALKGEIGPASFDWRMLLMMSVEENVRYFNRNLSVICAEAALL